MRQDRTMLASEQFIQAVLGEEYVTPVTDLMVDIFEETQPNKPVLYLLSAGADPTSSIDCFGLIHHSNPNS